MRADLHNNVKVSPALSPAAAITGNATTTGLTIDTVDYDSLEFAIQTGTVTDGQWAIQVFHGDASNMSDEAQCSAADLLGSAPTMLATDDNVVKKVGYRGSKRYVRIKAVQTGATTGGFLAAQAVQGHARVAPVA
jgi:hypothetical protein